MWWLGRIKSVRSPKAEGQATPNSPRDRLAAWLALVTVICLSATFVLSKGTQFLMPGPLASAHGAIENCNACHTKSGSGKLSWIHGLVAGDPRADSKACLTCHKMPDTAFNAHGASAAVLKQSTERLTKIAARTPAPQSARAQSIAFPTHDMEARGLFCATCHQEHQGVNFNLSKISNEQCRSCHVVKFDSFDGHHPKFENYPFKRRTRIIYDHAAHFGKHFPEVAKKHPARRIPETCSTCHNSREDKRVMAVAPFEKTCTACHLDQIIGKERVSGPKGIAFLALPGLDLQTLKKKKASIGQWPDDSEAELTPFMKVMISRDERGRDLVKTVDSLNLQDLSAASDDQIAAVTNLVWEVKGLFYALIKGKASDVLGNLNIGGGAKLSANLVADLTASIPRDVVIGAQQHWLPNLAAEMANRPVTRDRNPSGWNTVTRESRLEGSSSRNGPSGSQSRQTAPRVAAETADGREGAAAKAPNANAKVGGGKDTTNKLPPPMRAGVVQAGGASRPAGGAREANTANARSDDGKQMLAADDDGGGPITGRWSLPSGTPREISARKNEKAEKAAQPEDVAGKTDAVNAKADGGKETPAIDEEVKKATQPEGAAGKSNAADAKDARSAGDQPQGNDTAQTDDLLFPTEEELHGIKTGNKGAEKTVQPEGAAAKSDSANAKTDSAVSADAASKADANAPADASADSETAATAPQTRAAPVISIESDVDPESWAEYGGWYRQDYAIFYRPTGHKDKFIYSWLFLTGPQARKGDTDPAAAVFYYLTSKDAQGACTKCHSVDDIPGKGRVVNFSPPSVESKQGRFTNFIHEPHFGIMEDRGCLTCHNLEKGRPYLKSYKQGNPQNFVSNFGAVKKDLCQTCHTSTMARQDCLLCHKYHVNDVISPIINTKIPTR